MIGISNVYLVKYYHFRNVRYCKVILAKLENERSFWFRLPTSTLENFLIFSFVKWMFIHLYNIYELHQNIAFDESNSTDLFY